MTTTTNVTGNNASVINQINNANSASQTQMASGSGSKSSLAQQQLSGNLNTFLNMLTVQLKHQDPLSPMDDTQFTNQLVQFSGVEQQININSNLEQLITLQKTSQQASALGYIGQTVENSSNTMPLQGGQAAFSYTLPSNASNVVVTIKDSTGNIVATQTNVDGTVGRHLLGWDGTQANGGTATDGQYSLGITATDDQGNPVNATITTFGRVTGVTSDATNGTELQMGKVTMPLSSINAIIDPTTLVSK